MSDYENIKGVIRKHEQTESESEKDYYKRVTGKDLKYEDSIYESLYGDNLDETFVQIGRTLYEYIEYKDVEDSDAYINMEKLPNGDIKFHTRFYNGGTCVEEMLEDGIKKVK